MATEIERNLDHLRMASGVADPAAREDAYGVIVGMFTVSELKDLVMVLTEGALYGPDAAKALSKRLR